MRDDKLEDKAVELIIEVVFGLLKKHLIKILVKVKYLDVSNVKTTSKRHHVFAGTKHKAFVKY